MCVCMLCTFCWTLLRLSFCKVERDKFKAVSRRMDADRSPSYRLLNRWRSILISSVLHPMPSSVIRSIRPSEATAANTCNVCPSDFSISPWRTAFSTNGWRIILGTGNANASSDTSHCSSSWTGKRILCNIRYEEAYSFSSFRETMTCSVSMA